MKAIAAADLTFSRLSAGAAAQRMTVEHLGRPTLNGQPLPFSDAVRVGDMLYLSGQIGIAPDGKLPDGIRGPGKQTMDNIGAILKAARPRPMTISSNAR